MALRGMRSAKVSDNGERIAQALRQIFDLAEGLVIHIVQGQCQTAGYPPVETVIRFLDEDGRAYRIRFFKPLEALTPEDLPPKWLLPGLLDEGEACC